MAPEREQQIRSAWEIGKRRPHRWGDSPLLIEPPGDPEAAMVAFQLTAYSVDGAIKIIVAAEGLRVEDLVLRWEQAAQFERVGERPNR